jgi:hypothetical protein
MPETIKLFAVVLQGCLNVGERESDVRGGSKVSAKEAEEPVDVEVVAHDVTCR